MKFVAPSAMVALCCCGWCCLLGSRITRANALASTSGSNNRRGAKMPPFGSTSGGGRLALGDDHVEKARGTGDTRALGLHLSRDSDSYDEGNGDNSINKFSKYDNVDLFGDTSYEGEDDNEASYRLARELAGRRGLRVDDGRRRDRGEGSIRSSRSMGESGGRRTGASSGRASFSASSSTSFGSGKAYGNGEISSWNSNDIDDRSGPPSRFAGDDEASSTPFRRSSNGEGRRQSFGGQAAPRESRGDDDTSHRFPPPPPPPPAAASAAAREVADIIGRLHEAGEDGGGATANEDEEPWKLSNTFRRTNYRDMGQRPPAPPQPKPRPKRSLAQLSLEVERRAVPPRQPQRPPDAQAPAASYQRRQPQPSWQPPPGGQQESIHSLKPRQRRPQPLQPRTPPPSPPLSSGNFNYGRNAYSAMPQRRQVPLSQQQQRSRQQQLQQIRWQQMQQQRRASQMRGSNNSRNLYQQSSSYNQPPPPKNNHNMYPPPYNSQQRSGGIRSATTMSQQQRRQQRLYPQQQEPPPSSAYLPQPPSRQRQQPPPAAASSFYRPRPSSPMKSVPLSQLARRSVDPNGDAISPSSLYTQQDSRVPLSQLARRPLDPNGDAISPSSSFTQQDSSQFRQAPQYTPENFTTRDSAARNTGATSEAARVVPGGFSQRSGVLPPPPPPPSPSKFGSSSFKPPDFRRIPQSEFRQPYHGPERPAPGAFGPPSRDDEGPRFQGGPSFPFDGRGPPPPGFDPAFEEAMLLSPFAVPPMMMAGPPRSSVGTTPSSSKDRPRSKSREADIKVPKEPFRRQSRSPDRKTVSNNFKSDDVKIPKDPFVERQRRQQQQQRRSPDSKTGSSNVKSDDIKIPKDPLVERQRRQQQQQQRMSSPNQAESGNNSSANNSSDIRTPKDPFLERRSSENQMNKRGALPKRQSTATNTSNSSDSAKLPKDPFEEHRRRLDKEQQQFNSYKPPPQGTQPPLRRPPFSPSLPYSPPIAAPSQNARAGAPTGSNSSNSNSNKNERYRNNGRDSGNTGGNIRRSSIASSSVVRGDVSFDEYASYFVNDTDGDN